MIFPNNLHRKLLFLKIYDMFMKNKIIMYTKGYEVAISVKFPCNPKGFLREMFCITAFRKYLFKRSLYISLRSLIKLLWILKFHSFFFFDLYGYGIQIQNLSCCSIIQSIYKKKKTFRLTNV